MTSIKLDVPYFNQLDNDSNYFGSGFRQCCLTSNAMAANFILQDRGLESLEQRAKRLGLFEAESAYGEVLKNYGDSTDHTANTEALREFGLDSYFSTSLSVENAIASLDKKLPTNVPTMPLPKVWCWRTLAPTAKWVKWWPWPAKLSLYRKCLIFRTSLWPC